MKLLASRSAQFPLVAQIIASFNNWVTDSVDLTAKTLGSTPALSTDPAQAGLTGPVANTVTFDCIPLPVGAVITGGELIVDVAYVGPTAATISLGIAGATTDLLNAVSLLATGRTAFTLTGLVTEDSQSTGANLRMTLAYTVANATAGKFRLRVMYTVDGRAQEVQIA
ncbi:hypothetical protein [Herminiimonas sp. CN]|uniref:hypothetical protein n=1 Tax=Herminiimonas sp. CN TaxID=1349818 RepID=UPI0004740FE5|nr:hypothetical protein [Herminiimonas sp. CN]